MATSKAALVVLVVTAIFCYSNAAYSHYDHAKNRCQNAMNGSMTEAQRALSYIYKEGRPRNQKQRRAIDDCKELIESTTGLLSQCVYKLSRSHGKEAWSWQDEMYYRTWASAALTNEDTCIESLIEARVDFSKLQFTRCLSASSHLCSESLSLMNDVPVHKKNKKYSHPPPSTRKLMSLDDRGFPSWLSRADRRHLLKTKPKPPKVEVEKTFIVAKDGSGNFTDISDAIKAAPSKSKVRITIYIRAGVYEENIDVPKSKPNIMLIGDGIDVTVITGDRSVVGGYTTFRSATLATTGAGFMARDITFENTAGPEKHQAVAMRSGADKSAFYKCSFKGYQDTLYVHSLRQYYRECDIYGTVDFIFGNAAAMFQNCNLYARKPSRGQKIAFTAQGRVDKNQNTGISIHNSNITAAPDLAAVKNDFRVYLGRPWKAFSRTVIMQSNIDEIIRPEGWLEWSGDFALKTLYYGEFMNRGPGAVTDARVSWPGYHIMNLEDAQNYTVSNFVAGDAWLSSVAVPFDANLLS